MDIQKICLQCMREKTQPQEPCRQCGFNPAAYTMPQEALPPCTILQGRYLTGTVFDRDQYSLWYNGLDLMTNQKVWIREFYVNGLMRRQPDHLAIAYQSENRTFFQSARGKFAELGERLVQMGRLPGVAQVYTCFKENHTYYHIQETVDGVPLRSYVKRHVNLGQQEAVKKLLPVMHSLQTLHASGMSPCISSAKDMIVRTEGTVCLRSAVVPYAAEQGANIWVDVKGAPKDGVQSDIRIVEMVLHKLSGFSSEEGSAREGRYASMGAFLSSVSHTAMGETSRFPNMETRPWADDEGQGYRPMPGAVPEGSPDAGGPKKSKKGILIAAIIAGALVLAGAGVAIGHFVFGIGQEKETEAQSEGTADEGTIQIAKETEDQTETEAETETETETQPEAETDTLPETQPETETEEKTPETETETETQTETEPETETETETESETEEPAVPEAPAGTQITGKNTVMIFMVGSNLEADNELGTAEFSEIIGSGVDLSNTDILIDCGGCLEWHSYGIPNDQNTIWKVTENALEEVAYSDSAMNMGDSSTLTSFLGYCLQNYPADHYSLILWDHGGGPVYGFGADEQFDGDGLDLWELSEALENAGFGESQKLDWIGFDACLMGSLETADALDEYAEYLVASEDVSPGTGWDYSFLSAYNETSDPLTICQEIVRTYMSTHRLEEEEFYHPVLTISCMDLSRVAETVGALDMLFTQVNANSQTEAGYAANVQARDQAKRFSLRNTGITEYSYDLVDLGDLAALYADLYPSEGGALLDAVNHLVVQSEANVGRCSGVTLYYPYDYADQYTYYAKDYMDQFSPSAAFRTHVQTLMNDRDSKSSQTDWTLGTVAEDGTALSLTLTDAQQQTMVGAYYTVLYTEDGLAYSPVLDRVRMIPDASGRLSAPKDPGLIFASSNAEPEPQVVPVMEIETDDAFSYYLTQTVTMSEGWDDYNIFVDFFRAAATSELTFGGYTVEVSQELMQFGGRNAIEAGETDEFEYSFREYVPTRGRDGALLPSCQWDDAGGSGRTGTMTNDEGLYVQEIPCSQAQGSYALQMVVRDAYGQEHATELVTLS